MLEESRPHKRDNLNNIRPEASRTSGNKKEGYI
jgi:hypothetical protein